MMRETLRHGDAMGQWLSHDAICDVTQCHKMSRDVIVCVFNPTFCILMRYHSTACQEYPPDGHGCEGGVCAVDIGC